jgi:hypothetical protein
VTPPISIPVSSIVSSALATDRRETPVSPRTGGSVQTHRRASLFVKQRALLMSDLNLPAAGHAPDFFVEKYSAAKLGLTFTIRV